MSDTDEMNQQTEQIFKKMEAVYDETLSGVKALELEQKKIISDYLKEKEQEKIDWIKNSLTAKFENL